MEQNNLKFGTVHPFAARMEEGKEKSMMLFLQQVPRWTEAESPF
jgi:hypothetical protein